ncbi:hypothetical protein [Paenibacillus barengoltzii]|uniref:hypothetical protein n=1 Tax=Paenibacillus barengoltzii TaxID=343517 RepID=UPI0005607EE6
MLAMYTWWYIENVSPVKVTKTFDGAAWMEEDPTFAPPVHLSLDGYYDKRNAQFKGAVKINGQVYDNCFLVNGSGHRYEGANLIRLGASYFDAEMVRIAWSIPQSELPPELTHPKFPDAEIWLISPASSGEEASNLRQELVDCYFAKLKLK